MKIYIYKITNNINGKIYIGKHIDKSETGFDDYMGSGIKIIMAQKKYGKENFTKEILEECVLDNIDEREKFWIKKFNSTNRDIGYNITSGGDGGDTLTTHPDLNLIKQKMSKSSPRRSGWHHSEQTKEKISKINLGRKLNRVITEEQRREISERLKGKNNPNFGKHKTVEERRIIKEANTGLVYWNNGKINKRSKSCPGEGWVKGILVSQESADLRSKTHKGIESAFKGKHHTAESRLKLSKSHKGLLKGANNPAAKSIEIISPTGEIFNIKGTLKLFCQEHKLSYTMARKYIDQGPCPNSKFINNKNIFAKNTVNWTFNTVKK